MPNEPKYESEEKMETNSVECDNPYGLPYDQLRRNILAAATVDEPSLEDAGIEMSEGWLPEQFQHESDCAFYLDDFEFMKHLNANGDLEKPFASSVVVKMARHDVFLALAKHENDLAEYYFSGKAVADGWNREEAFGCGLRAALAANKAFEYALRLKTSRDKETTSKLRRH